MVKRQDIPAQMNSQPQPSQAVTYFSAFAAISPETRALILPDALPQLHHHPAASLTDCQKGDMGGQGSAEPWMPGDLSQGAGNRSVVICLHGFSGMPYELIPGLESLAQAGITAAAPLLPRHGYRALESQHREFALLTSAELLAAARQEIAIARQSYNRVGLMGFSMGGAIALTLAAEGLVDACVAMAPALRLPLQAELLIPLLGWADFELDAKSHEPFYFPKYEFHHARSLLALWQLAVLARKSLTKINCPLQVIHSQQDNVISPRVVELIQKQVPGPVEIAWFNQSGHVMLRDRAQVDVARSLSEFMQRQLN